ncbi:Gp37-like protein [Viridibacillus sp. NPDC093762]|uniref:Gp37-like protein n=1 Tax=Viridibacillus sp. NPDC093762 TaxID=3390720 RepID=UPI003CFE3036
MNKFCNSQNALFVYGRDWQLGDYVTIKHDDWGVQKKMRIITIKEVLDENGFKRFVEFVRIYLR